MRLDKHEQQVVKAEVARLRESEHSYGASGIVNDFGSRADALEAILPKPRFYADGRDVWERVAGGELCKLHFVDRECCPDDATAALIAWDFADALNKRLGEEAS